MEDFRRQIGIVDGADAEHRQNAQRAALVGDPGHDLVPQVLDQIEAEGHDEAEVVPLEIARHAAVLLAEGLHGVGDVAQETVSHVPPVEFIEQTKVQYVDCNHAVGVGLGALDKPSGLLHEALWEK